MRLKALREGIGISQSEWVKSLPFVALFALRKKAKVGMPYGMFSAKDGIGYYPKILLEEEVSILELLEPRRSNDEYVTEVELQVKFTGLYNGVFNNLHHRLGYVDSHMPANSDAKYIVITDLGRRALVKLRRLAMKAARKEYLAELHSTIAFVGWLITTIIAIAALRL